MKMEDVGQPMKMEDVGSIFIGSSVKYTLHTSPMKMEDVGSIFIGWSVKCILHTSAYEDGRCRSAYEDGTNRRFRNVGNYKPDVGELH